MICFVILAQHQHRVLYDIYPMPGVFTPPLYRNETADKLRQIIIISEQRETATSKRGSCAVIILPDLTFRN